MRTPSASADDIDPMTLMGAIRRGLPKLLVWTISVFALTFGVLTLVAPRFESEAQLTIDAKSTVSPYNDPKQPGPSPDSTASKMDPQAINTHIKALQSPALAAKIVAELGLKDKVEFNSELGDIDMMGSLLRKVGLGGSRAGQSEQDRVLEAYFGKLSVYSARESRFIGIKFLSSDPQLAASISNAIAEAYVNQLAGQKVDETKDVQNALSPKIEQLKGEVAAAEVAVEQFRGKTDSFNTGAQQKQTLNEQQLGELTNELSRAQAARSDSESRARSAQDLLRAGSGEALPDVQKSPLIQNLVQQRVRAERQIAEVSASLLPGHPRMQQLNADLGGLKKQITAEVTKIVDGLGKEAKVAADREASVKKRLSELKVTVVNAGPDEAKLKMLVADAKSKRDELERLQAQFNANTTRATAKAVPVEAKLLSPATPASVPVFPKKMPWAALAALAAFILGLAMQVLAATAQGARSGGSPRPAPAGGSGGGRDSASSIASRMRSSPARATMAGAASAAAASVATSAPAMADAMADHTYDGAHVGTGSDRHHDAFAGQATQDISGGGDFVVGSVDALVAHAIARTPERGGYRTLMAGENGRVDATRAAVDLARGLAAAGQPVILVEWSYGDHEAAIGIGAENAPGIAELLNGEATFEDVIAAIPGSEAHFIAAGNSLADAPAALDPDQVNLILDALDEAYAHIVVVGEHDGARHLFETIQGRFDAAVVVADPSAAAAVLRDPAGTFLGFEVADIDIIRFEPAEAVRSVPAPAAKEPVTRQIRGLNLGSRASQTG
jgi:polysaccharide biosynthesis transport protein